MKVSREQETFKPVTITLESYEEVALIKGLLGLLTNHQVEKVIGKKFNAYPMYYDLDNATPEIKVGVLDLEIKIKG